MYYRAALNDSSEGKSFQRVELSVVHEVICFVWKEKGSEVRTYIDS